MFSKRGLGLEFLYGLCRFVKLDKIMLKEKAGNMVKIYTVEFVHFSVHYVNSYYLLFCSKSRALFNNLFTFHALIFINVITILIKKYISI